MAQRIPKAETDVSEEPQVDPSDEEKPQTAQELFRIICRSGLVGMWKDRKDITDSSEFARKLRERAQSRQWE
jgi:hypothetical protein